MLRRRFQAFARLQRAPQVRAQMTLISPCLWSLNPKLLLPKTALFCRVHFKFKHDAILKQLETWQATDPGLKASCDQIRSALDQYRTKEGLPIGT